LEVIDAHVHTFPEKVAGKAVSKLAAISGITPATDGTVPDTLKKLEECRVDRAFFLNIATVPHQQATINRCAKALNEEKDGKAWSFGSVHFAAEDALEELDRIHALGLPGVKLHPDYQGFLIDDRRLYPIYERCAALKLPVVFHSGWDCYSPELVHAPPERSLRVMRDFPELKMVLAHFGGLKCWDEVERLLIGENVWLDTAMCQSFADPAQIKRMILRHDPDRILLGSDCPWEDPARSVQFILDMDLPPALTEKILAKNARRLIERD